MCCVVVELCVLELLEFSRNDSHFTKHSHQLFQDSTPHGRRDVHPPLSLRGNASHYTSCKAQSGHHSMSELHVSSTVTLAVDLDEGMREPLMQALRNANLASDDTGSQLTISISEHDPLPDELLQACRLHCLTAAELLLHEAKVDSPVRMIGPSNEQRALLKAREVLRGRPASEEAVAHALRALCESCNVGHGQISGSRAECESVEELRRKVMSSINAPNVDGVVQLAPCAYGGRGLVSARDLATGESVVSIPADALLSVAAARRDPLLSPLLHLVDEGAWTEHVVVILLLLHERRKGPRSRWATWLDALPGTWNNLCSWTDEEASLLSGTAAYWRAHASKEELKQIREDLLPKLRAAAGTDGAHSAVMGDKAFPEESFSFEQWLWARSVIETRALCLPSDLLDMKAGCLVLAPGIDFANHSEAAELQLHVDAERRTFCLRTVCTVACGHQLHLSYGSLDAEELLEHHGIADVHPPPPQTMLESDVASAAQAMNGSRSARWLSQRPGEPLRVGVPLRLTISLQPGELLFEERGEEIDEGLLGTVLLIMQHTGLSLEALLPEPPFDDVAQGKAPQPSQSVATATAHEDEATRAERKRRLLDVLPGGLLGCARLCCLTRPEELTELPVGVADRQPLSVNNERDAIRLLRGKCVAQLSTERTALGEDKAEAGAAAQVQMDQAGSPRAKRQRRHQQEIDSEERMAAAKHFGRRRQRVLELALEALDVMEAELH